MDAETGRGILPGQFRATRASDQVGNRTLHPEPRAGDELQNRHDRHATIARRSESRPRRKIRLPNLSRYGAWRRRTADPGAGGESAPLDRYTEELRKNSRQRTLTGERL